MKTGWFVAAAGGIALICGCATGNPEAAKKADSGCESGDGPCIVKPTGKATKDGPFAGGDLFAADYKSPAKLEGKRLWAASYLYAEAPKTVAEEWIGPEPDTKGKYVLLEIWNTWCPPCRRSLALLNGFHERYGDELVVIGLCDESVEAVKACMERPDCGIKFFNAVDTQGKTKAALGVVGVPHTIVIEPGGYVVWEGFPLQKGYELTDAVIEKILAVGRAQTGK
jgi:cytochrome c biogenesis protein CcmG, thiol:disulfide interchange protein DsbE